MNDTQDIYSFDSTCYEQGSLVSPDRYRDLFRYCQKDFIPRGSGSSYVLASAGHHSQSVCSEHFNRILSWDPNSGEIEVESGMTLGHLLQFLISHGFWFPVLPGHADITVGGALAFNIHGKSQSNHGLFGAHVQSFKLFHPDHGWNQFSAEHDSQIFDLTLGGMGLTGYVTSVVLKAQKLLGKSILKKRIPCQNITHGIELMKEFSKTWDNVYSWNNFNLKGNSFGRGWVYAEKFDELDISSKFPMKKSSLIYPLRNRGMDHLLQKVFMPHLSKIYEISESLKPETQRMDLFRAAFPFCGKEIYHRFFASHGLREYQVIIPWEKLSSFLQAIQDEISKINCSFSLGSLKIFHGKKRLLNFNGQGLCLAFDAENSEPTMQLFAQFDRLAIEHDGIPNISKDSRLSSSVVQKTYGENYHLFKENLEKWDPHQRIQSHLRSRLCL